MQENAKARVMSREPWQPSCHAGPHFFGGQAVAVTEDDISFVPISYIIIPRHHEHVDGPETVAIDLTDDNNVVLMSSVWSHSVLV